MKTNKNTALPAKISRPRLASNVLFRKRLFSILKDRLREKALWVSGPAGAGKTTLVNSYIEASRIRTLWYQVDAADADPATFFHYLKKWIDVLSGKGSAMPKFSPQAASDPAAFSKIYFEEFFKQFTSPILVVLDNFQEASNCREFIEAVSAGIKLAPAGSAFVLISRTEPIPELASSEPGSLPVVGWDDVRLTESESSEIARLHGVADLAGEGIGELHSKSDGWIAGLLLLLEQAKAGKEGLEEISYGAGNLSFNYFMSEVFEKIDPVTQEFLLKCSIFQDISPRMAMAISGEKQAERILNAMGSGNFFVARRASEGGDSYQFHPLFRDFLLERAKSVYSPEEMNALISRAAVLSVESGQADWAAHLFIEAQDWSGLSLFVHEHAPSFISDGRFRALQDILKELPDAMVSGSPWLLYYYGLCRLPISPSEARERFEAAYALFEPADDHRGSFLAWCGAVDTVLYEWKDFKPLEHWITEFERLMGKYGGFVSKEIEIRATTCIFSAIMFRQPDSPALPEWERRISSLVKEVSDNALKISITRNLILYYLWTGNVDKAGALVESLKPAAGDVVKDPLAQLMWLRSAALYRMFLSSSQAALEAIDEGLALADKTGIHLLDHLFFGVGIYASMILGDLKKAEEFLAKMRRGVDSEKCLDLIYYNHQASMISWWKGSMPEAIAYAEVALDLTNQSGARINRVIYEGAYILQLIDAELYVGVDERIMALRDYGRAIGSNLHESIGLLAASFLFFKRGDLTAFTENFEKFVALAIRQRINSIGSLFIPSSLAPLCAKALELGIEPEHVKKIIRLNNLDRFPPGPEVEKWPWEIKARALGTFEIYRDGEKIEFSRKAQHKPFFMLKELISAGGRPVPEGALTDALWPISEGDLAYRSFNTTVHRLRKLLGSEKAVRHVDGMLSLDTSRFWVDAWALEYLLDKTETAPMNEMEAALEKAAAMYQGEYLPEETAASAVSFRERLKARFLNCIEKAGARYEDAGDREKALEIYRKGIEAEELAENLYRRAIACLGALENKIEAQKTYEKLKSILFVRLGVKPSKETDDLLRFIMEKEPFISSAGITLYFPMNNSVIRKGKRGKDS